MAENNYGRFTVGKLKDELAKRGAWTTGRKEALIERMVSDHGMAHDLKTLQKGEELMESDRVSACK
ncbi:uncharacterized protein LOC126824336 [Patella vulgata]|uniref:uncharacterized protein LOC126824336 n=1 Tax=Patella vulgata TaxID=6465 RepID=UPI0024A7B020|nr:uncharacterized protein LOC126824336 [Patella vulgata]